MSFISMRASVVTKDSYHRFLQSLELYTRYRELCDDIWFSSDYGFPPLEKVRQTAEQTAFAAAAARKAGIGASLQISNTLGHGDYNNMRDYSGITWQHMIGQDGVAAGYCNCPRDERFHAYLREYVRLHAAWKPDVVWIDDDLRMNNHRPADWGCFCQSCLHAFSQETGKAWERESLVEALNCDTEGVLRKSWTAFNTRSSIIVLDVILDALAEVSPRSRVGIQSAGPDYLIYSGDTFLQDLADEVEKKTGKKMFVRPGGGYYSDDVPMGMVDKSFIMSQAAHVLAGRAERFTAEVEAYPHTVSCKSPQGLISESMLYLAQGCDSLSYATMMLENERPAYFEDALKEMREWLPLWKEYCAGIRDTAVGGLRIYYDGAQAGMEKPDDFCWARERFLGFYRLAASGLILSFSTWDGAPVLLHEDMAEGISKERLQEILAKGVLTSGAAVEILEKRGMGELLGISAHRLNRADCFVRFTDGALGGELQGESWIQPVPPGVRDDYFFEPRTGDFQIWSTYQSSHTGKTEGAESLAGTTPGGGRLAVLGYAAWHPILNTARRRELLAMADWVGGGRIPVWPKTAGRYMVIPRVTQEGTLVNVMVLNASIGTASGIELVLKGDLSGKRAIFVRKDQRIEVPLVPGPDGFHCVLPPIPGWNAGVLEL